MGKKKGKEGTRSFCTTRRLELIYCRSVSPSVRNGIDRLRQASAFLPARVAASEPVGSICLGALRGTRAGAGRERLESLCGECAPRESRKRYVRRSLN